MRHPDGDIPLFNDAVLGVVGPPDDALAAGARFFGEPHELLNWRALALLGKLPRPLGAGWGEGRPMSSISSPSPRPRHKGRRGPPCR